MYDEFERAAGVRRRPGISLLGWMGIGLVVFLLLAATGTWFAYRFVRGQLHEVAERIEVRPSADAPRVVARTVARTLGEMGTAPASREEGITAAVARALGATDLLDGDGRPPAATVVGVRAGDRDRAGLQEPAPTDRPEAARVEDDEVEGFLRIRTGDGEVVADLRAGRDGGSLIVRSDGGEVLVDLSADARGGRLFLRDEGEVARFETGVRADPVPRWVPAVGGTRMEVEPVISGFAGEGSFGAETWESPDGPEEMVADYRARLLESGWEVRAEHRLDAPGGRSASVVAHRDGRTVVLSAEREDGRTRAALGWGEHR